jgi:hypothetical protein
MCRILIGRLRRPANYCELGKRQRDFFRQPAANRIGDANHLRAGMTLKERIGPACGKQGALPVSLSEESRGFGLCDNKKHNPRSNGANDFH